MKNYSSLFAFLILLQCSCTNAFQANIDDGKTISTEEIKVIKADLLKAPFDTSGVYLAPIKITKLEFESYRNTYQVNLKLAYKNASHKKINVIKFTCYAEDIYNNPAGHITHDEGKGYTNFEDISPLMPNEFRNRIFEMNYVSLKKIDCAWPTSIKFEDGTNWDLRK